MTQRKLDSIESLDDPGSRGYIVINSDGQKLEIFVVRRDTQITAWVNQCPHKGMPLEWQPDEFLDDEGEHIICATHGALFDIQNGGCLSGPCRGQGLKPVAIERIGKDIYLSEDSGLEIIKT
jgi:nitrite reductase/ring-hydroxylating ferredoxin subunit